MTFSRLGGASSDPRATTAGAMARRKSKLMDDYDSSEDSEDARDDLGEDPYDPNDPDEAAARELFHDPYGRRKKRARQDLQEESTYGIWAETSDKGDGSGNARGRAGRTATRRADVSK